MKTNCGTISWITKRAKALEQQRFLALRQVLTRQGYKLEWHEAPVTQSTTELQAWLSTNVSLETSAIMFGDKDLKFYGELAKNLRSTANVKLRHIPLFWIYEDVDHQLLDQLVEVGVDDFFHVSHKPDDLLSRLRLRIRESESKVVAEERWQEQAIKNAKTETTLKQREEFLSVCAHDLRSPLGLIQSSIAMVLNAPGAKSTVTPFQTELLTRAKRQATQAITLVNDLLDVMSFEQGWKPRYQMVILDDLLSEMFSDYTFQAAQKNIKIHYENPIKDWRILADADRVRQLFLNLFTNAMKFTDEGKNIFLNVSAFIGRRKNDPTYPMLIISLKDEGKGIPEREMQRIFDRFAQIKEHTREGGRGLGLTVAKQISNLHDGNIWVESKEGKGSTFNVLFPHTISQVVPIKNEQARSVVIAEPKEENRAKYYGDLPSWGINPIFAKDGVEALTFAFNYAPQAMILSPVLAKLGEAEVINILKSDVLTSHIPVLLATDDEKSLSAAMVANIFHKVVKLPLKKEVLLDSLTPEKKIKAAA